MRLSALLLLFLPLFLSAQDNPLTYLWPAGHDAYEADADTIGYFEMQVSYDDGEVWHNTDAQIPVKANERVFYPAVFSMGWTWIDDYRIAQPEDEWWRHQASDRPGDYRLMRTIFRRTPGENGYTRQ